MKKAICILLLGTMVLSLFAGCGKPEEQTEKTESPASAPAVTEAPETTEPGAETLLWNFHEEHPVDDSMTVSCEEETVRGYSLFEESILPKYQERWAENAQVLDKEIYCLNGEYFYGWVLFSGTPNPENGWNTFQWEGQPAFCRRFLGRLTEDTLHLEQTQAAAPLPGLPMLGSDMSHSFGEGHPVLKRDLSGLCRAELYVRQLGRSFMITEPEKLALLSSGLLELSEYWNLLRFGGIPLEMNGNPLILDLGEQGQRQIMTDTAGRASTTAWGARIPLMAQSLFELFGVPLEAEGYSRDDRGNTVVELVDEPFLETEEDRAREITVLISPDNRLLSQTSTEHIHDGDYESTGTEVQSFTYNAMGKPEMRRITSEGISSLMNYQIEEVERYTYDEQGRRIRTDFEKNGAAEGYNLFEYDDQGRQIAVLWYLPDGTLGPASRQQYCWYDENGLQYDYRYDDRGNVEGTPPDTPMRRNSGKN